MNWKTLCFASLGLSVALVVNFNIAASQAGPADSMSGSMSGQTMKGGCNSMQSPSAMSGSSMAGSMTHSPSTMSGSSMSGGSMSGNMTHSPNAMSSSSTADTASCDMMQSPSSPSINPGSTSR